MNINHWIRQRYEAQSSLLDKKSFSTSVVVLARTCVASTTISTVNTLHSVHAVVWLTVVQGWGAGMCLSRPTL